MFNGTSDRPLRRRKSTFCMLQPPLKIEEDDRMKPETEKTKEATDLAKMSIKAGVEGEGKPMVIKKADPTLELKGRMQPIGKPRQPKPTRTSESIF